MVIDLGLFRALWNLKLTSSTLRVDDDFIDRLNHYYTGIIIIIFTLVVSAKQYVGQPLQCWVPAHYTAAMEQYTENYCWVQSTYYLPLTSHIPHDRAHRESRKIGYYQWVPFVLTLEAFLFYLPYVVWRLMNWQSGVNFHAIMRLAASAQGVSPDKRDRTIKSVARHIDDALQLRTRRRESPDCWKRSRRFLNRMLCLLCSRDHGLYLTVLYMLIKMMYIVNCIGQFFLLNAFLESPYELFGLRVLHNMITGKSWSESGIFPRVTMCDFEIRVLGNLHNHTVQCVLVINLFNEKIFVFLWFWFFLMTVLNLLSLMTWMARQFFAVNRFSFVRDYLKMSNSLKQANARRLQRFVSEYLQSDGVFVLRMVATNSGDVIASEVTRSLWSNFLVICSTCGMRERCDCHLSEKLINQNSTRVDVV